MLVLGAVAPSGQHETRRRPCREAAEHDGQRREGKRAVGIGAGTAHDALAHDPNGGEPGLSYARRR